MTATRRTFIKTGVATAALAALPRPSIAHSSGPAEEVSSIQDPRVKQLVQRGLDVARSTGASYADVRMSYMRDRRVYAVKIFDSEGMSVGVRALVNGYWGFASGPVWGPEEMARLGREAVRYAKINALGKPRSVDMAAIPVIRDSHWVMPVKVDPFEIHPAEIQDRLRGLAIYLRRASDTVFRTAEARFSVHEKAFGSTDGSYCTQRLYRTSGECKFTVKDKAGQDWSGEVDGLTPVAMGWELFRDQPLYDMLQAAIDDIRLDIALGIKAVDVGRFDVVFDQLTVARLASLTLGAATQLDRAFGYEANAGGTSYLNKPLEMRGTLQVASPLVTVSADRSTPGSAATVKWDDEGVAPDTFDVVQKGVLADFSTTRESAGWLKRDGSAPSSQSHGCAYAPSAIDVPLAHTPNLVIAPGEQSLDFDSLVSGMRKGVAIRTGRFNMDFQQLNGHLSGRTYEVKDGKRTSLLGMGGVIFRTPDLWKSIIGIGGANSATRVGLSSTKGEPPQYAVHSVTAVPLMFKDLAIIDTLRRA